MSQSRALPADGLKRILERTAGDIRQTTVREAWFGVGWRWLAILAGLFVLDLLFALPVWLRWAGLLGQAGFIVWRAHEILRRRGRVHIGDQQAARAVEQRHPEVDNALIHAVQFGESVSEASALQAPLMRREIERGEAAAREVPAEGVVSRASEKRALRRLGGFAGAWALVALLFPGVFLTVTPRLFAPWMDDVTPPFSFTKITVSPRGATVRYGESLLIRVEVAGPIPDDLTLATRTSKSGWRDVALESNEPGKYSVTLADLHEDTWFYAKGGGARSSRYLIKVVLPPEVELVRAIYTYPRYANRQPNAEKIGPQGVHGLPTTHVLIEVIANRPLSAGEMAIDYGAGKQESLPLTVDTKDHRIARVELTIRMSGTYRISLVGDDGQPNADAARGKIVVEHDQHPTVWFDEPGPEMLVTPDMKVPIVLEAEDDIGVARVEMHRLINDLADNPSLIFRSAPVKHMDQRLVMDLADLGVRPGDQITYWAAAFDNDPGQSNYAETEPYHLRVVSREEFLAALKQQRDAEHLAQEVGDILSALKSLAEQQKELADKMDLLQKQLAHDPGSAALRKEMQEAREDQKALQQDAQRMAEQMAQYAQSPSASDIEAAIKRQVAALAQKVGNAASGPMQGAQSANPTEAAANARRAAQALQQAAGQAQNHIGKAIEHIEQVAPLFADVERFKQLLERQGQLVLQARQFQDRSATDRAARAQMLHIAAEQERIQQALTELQADFRRHAAAARTNFPKAAASALRIADEIGTRQIPGLMGAAHDRFSENNGPQGFEEAQRALQQMQAMISKCGSCQGACEGELDIKLAESLGQNGLGQSLSACVNPGFGTNDGSGGGIGAGGSEWGPNGNSGGGFSIKVPRAYVMSMRLLHGSAGSKRQQAKNRLAGLPAGLAADNIELMKSLATQRPKGSDSSAAGYPVEYRKLIDDYFISVAREKR